METAESLQLLTPTALANGGVRENVDTKSERDIKLRVDERKTR